MRKGWIICALTSSVFAAAGLASPATRPADPATQQTPAASEQSAIQFGRMWAKEVNAGRAGEALKTYLDTNALLASICGEKYNSLPDADKAQCQQDMQRIMLAIHANPAIRRMMMQATFGGFSAKRDDQGRYLLDYVVTTPDHLKTIPNSLLLVFQNGQWRVIDMSVKGAMLGPTIQAEYRTAGAGMSPKELTAALVKVVEQKLGQVQ